MSLMSRACLMRILHLFTLTQPRVSCRTRTCTQRALTLLHTGKAFDVITSDKEQTQTFGTNTFKTTSDGDARGHVRVTKMTSLKNIVGECCGERD